MLGNIGLPEILVIATVLFIFFGPKYLIELGRELGKAVREFKNVDQDYKEIVDEIKSPPKKTEEKVNKKKKGVKKG